MATRRQVHRAPANAWGPLPPHATAPAIWWHPASAGRPSSLRWLERALLAIAIACLGYYGYVSAETMLYQAYENRELDALLRTGVASAASPAAPGGTARRTLAPGQTIGRIEIPRLGVSAIIKAGIDTRTLQLAVGHIPGTAIPGEKGNVGLAAHRDTFFRRLGEVQSDDEIRVTTSVGAYRYRVERTDVVDPRDVWVLDRTEQPALTLVTCYPFRFVGSAPQRFVVRAQMAR